MTAASAVFHPAETTRDQEWLKRALAESEAKREVGTNYEEVKLREDKG